MRNPDDRAPVSRVDRLLAVVKCSEERDVIKWGLIFGGAGWGSLGLLVAAEVLVRWIAGLLSSAWWIATTLAVALQQVLR